MSFYIRGKIAEQQSDLARAGRTEGRNPMPKTKLGKWAGGLLAVFVVLLVALILGMKLAGLTPGTPLIITLGTCMTISAIAVFVTGAVALMRFKDRSFVVILAVALGFIASLLTIMEAVEGVFWRSTH